MNPPSPPASPIVHSPFPWRIFSGVVLTQAIAILTLFFLSGLGARIYFRSRFLALLDGQSLSSLNEALHIYDVSMGLLLSGTAALLFIFALALAQRLVFPIGRLLLKTQKVLNHETDFEKLGEETFGEWTDLESSIEAIRKDLEIKIESLTLEREEQATLMSAISDAILAIDLDGSPLFYNSRFALLFENDELKKKKHLLEIFRDPDIPAAFQSALKEGRSNIVKAIPLDSPSGKAFFSVSISPLKKNKECVYGAVGIFHDVTDLKRAEQIRIDFVANVSHELRTPLTAIKGYADTLIQDSRENKPLAPEFLEIIARNTTRLMDLINDLLDLSSLESPDVIQKQLLSTEELTFRIIHQMKGPIESKNQNVQVTLGASSVLADPRRVEQVLINLLDNASKYSPINCQISVHWEISDLKNVVLKVVDSGPGISQEHQNRLFERFYRVDKARSREQGGTGLGLAIVKHIMQRHDGSVWVDSKPGYGSTFLCRFPH